MEALNSFLSTVNDWVWGIPLIVLIIAIGVLMTVRTGLIQIIHLPKAIRYMLHNEEDGEGDVTSFGALCTALSATIGTGNIVGVATALVAGGAGALFWMWISAFFGMATAYTESVLACSPSNTVRSAKTVPSSAARSITSKKVWAKAGNGLPSSLQCSECLSVFSASVR